MKLLPIWKVILVDCWNGLQIMEWLQTYKKFQLMFLGLKGQRRLRLNINEDTLSATDHVKLLGIEIDNKLKFNKHVQMLCSKVNKKISDFCRLNSYISREQALKICNAVVLSNFNCCPFFLAIVQKRCKQRD